MPTWGDDTRGGGTEWEQTQTTAEQIAELKDWLGRFLYVQNQRGRAFEDAMGGSDGSPLEYAAGAAGLAALFPGAAPVAIPAAAILAALKPVYGSHLLSNIDAKVGRLIFGDSYAAWPGNTGWVPMIRRDDLTLQDDVGVVQTTVDSIDGKTDTIITQTAELTQDDLDDIAGAVWGYVATSWSPMGGHSSQAIRITLTSIANLLMQRIATEGIAVPNNPDFRIHGNFGAYVPGNFAVFDLAPTASPPGILDWSQLARDDTVLTFLQRVKPAYTWTETGPWQWPATTGYVWTLDPTNGYYWYRCTVSPLQLEQKKESLFGSAGLQYPGSDNVTPGTPVAFTESGEVNLAMDGCTVELTDIPPGQGAYTEGHATRYPYIGWLTFYDADGMCDGLQKLEYQKTVFRPLAMARAAGVVFSVKIGTEGTLTPYDIGTL